MPLQQGESDITNNRIEHEVYVAEAKRIKVLYIEGNRRYEYRFIKTLFEREQPRPWRGNKSIDLEVFIVVLTPTSPSRTKAPLPNFPRRPASTITTW